MTEQFDVVVVGAGPAGSQTARLLARAQKSVLLLEKRPVVGVPVRCGEASSPLNDLSRLVEINPDWVESELHRVVLYTPDKCIDWKHKNLGSILDREIFDQDLAKQASKAGAILRTDHRVSAITSVQNGMRTLTVVAPEGEYTVQAKMVVAADGVESLCGQWVGLKCRQGATQVCTALEYQIEGVDPHPDAFTFWMHYPGIPKGYVWAFPKQKSGRINLGCGAITPKLNEPNMRQVLDAFKAKFYPDYPLIKVHGGAVPVSGNLKQSSTDHFLLVGDSAHHTDPLTGGGIAVSLESAGIAAKWILKGLEDGDLSESFFKSYDQNCWEYFGFKHRKQMRLRDWLFKLSERDRNIFYAQLTTLCEGDFAWHTWFKTAPSLLGLLFKTQKEIRQIWKNTSEGFTYSK